MKKCLFSPCFWGRWTVSLIPYCKCSWGLGMPHVLGPLSEARTYFFRASNKGHPYWPCPCSNWKETGCRAMQQELGQQAEPRAGANRTLLSCPGGKAESHPGVSAGCISATHRGMSNSASALEMTVIYLFPLKSSKKRQDFDLLLWKEHHLVTDWNHRINTLRLEEIAMPISEAGCDD